MAGLGADPWHRGAGKLFAAVTVLACMSWDLASGARDLKRRHRWQGTWGLRRRWLKAPAMGTTGGVRSGVGESIPGDKMT